VGWGFVFGGEAQNLKQLGRVHGLQAVCGAELFCARRGEIRRWMTLRSLKNAVMRWGSVCFGTYASCGRDLLSY